VDLSTPNRSAITCNETLSPGFCALNAAIASSIDAIFMEKSRVEDVVF
jgi:hypothetical protein